jgi:signal transduction histidine kinase
MLQIDTLRARWSPPPAAVDAALALAVLAAHTAPFLFTTRLGDPAAGWTVWQYLPVLAQSAPLLWRRRAPLTVLVLVLAGQSAYSAFDPDTAPQEVPYAALVAVYTVAAHGGRRTRRWAMGIVAAVGSAQLLGVVLDAPSGETAARGVILMATAWILGRLMASRQAYAEKLRQEKEDEAQRAAAQERAMIARDMHDVLGHAISLMVVQAEAGPVVVRTDPDRAEAVFDAIAEAGRDAMAQVRRLLGLWDARDREDTVRLTVAGIGDLVEGVNRTGPHVELRTTGTPGALPPDTEVAAFRVVQEALTNLVRHAESTSASVALEWGAETLSITVTDNGRGGDATGTAGRGLIGIRERARACGGSASFGPGPEGSGFAVTVLLPRSPV